MQPSGLETAFAELQDPRREQGRLHKLIDFIVMFIRAVICGGEGGGEFQGYMNCMGKALYLGYC